MYESKYRRRLHTINRKVLVYLLSFHRLTSGAYGSAQNTHKWWPRVVFCVYLYCATTIAINLHFQYPYDMEKKRLKQFRAYAANDSYMRQQLLLRYDGDLGAYERRSELRIRELHDSLKLVGAPHLEWSMAVECVYSYILGASIFSFILWPLYIKWRHLKFACLEHFLVEDPARNARNNLELVRNEMQQLIHLSKSHTHAQLKEISGKSYRSWPIVQQIVHKHQLTCWYLRSIVRSIEYPLNRQPERLDFWALMNVMSFTSIYVYGTACIIQLYLMVQDYYATSTPAEFETWRDLATLMSSAFLLFIVLNSGALFGIINILLVMDQIKAATELKRLIRQLLERNERSACELVSSCRSQLKSKQLIEKIDLDLLSVIMQIRLFDRDFQQARLHYNWLLVDYIFFTGGLPIITRFLYTYMDSDLKTFAFFMAIPGLIPMFMAIFPMCYLNSRCLDTYILLSSLVAQLSRFESTPTLKEQLNHEFVFNLLRKQLAISDRFVDKYATRTFLIDFNYSNILRVAFYLSLVLFSILFTTPTGDQTTTSSNLSPGYTIFKRIRSDPLGVYRY